MSAASITYTPGPDAVPIPPIQLPYVPVKLPDDLQDRFDQLRSHDLDDIEVQSLRRDISRVMKIPWISVYISSRGVMRHDLFRGGNIQLPHEWNDRIERMSAVEDAAWDQLRVQVARFVGLPLKHVELIFDDFRGVWGFRRSLVPNDGEIEDEQELIVPEESRADFYELVATLRNSRNPLPRNRAWLMSDLIYRVATVYRLPRGRIKVQIQPVAKFVYKVPFSGELLRGSSELATRLGEILVQDNHIGLEYLQRNFAHYYGVEYNELNLISTEGGGFLYSPSEQRFSNVFIPPQIADRFDALCQQVRELTGRQPPAELEQALLHLQSEVAKYNGLESDDIERFTTSDGGIDFRRREARERPRRGKKIDRRLKRNQLVLDVEKPTLTKSLPDSDSLGIGAVIGIVLGSSLCIILIFLLIIFIRKRRIINNA